MSGSAGCRFSLVALLWSYICRGRVSFNSYRQWKCDYYIKKRKKNASLFPRVFSDYLEVIQSELLSGQTAVTGQWADLNGVCGKLYLPQTFTEAWSDGAIHQVKPHSFKKKNLTFKVKRWKMFHKTSHNFGVTCKSLEKCQTFSKYIWF